MPFNPVRPGLLADCANARDYVQEIERLHSARSLQRAPVSAEGEPDFSRYYLDRHRLGKLLARSVGRGEYRFSTAQLRQLNLSGKARPIYAFTWMDRIVHGVAARVLERMAEPHLHDSVHSYRKGRGRLTALRSFEAFLASHRAALGDPRMRGLSLLRCDIASCGESIAVLPSAPLWTNIEALAARRYGRAATETERTLLASLLRPELSNADGAVTPLYGIPDGSPLGPLMLNLALSPIDEALGNIPDGFYARYGDDLLFAHAGASQFAAACDALDGTLHRLGLRRNERKTRCMFYNGAGREGHGLKGANAVEYLGYRISFHGQHAPRREKLRALRQELRRRVHATARLLQGAPMPELADTLCRIANATLDPRDARAGAHAELLAYQCSDRGTRRQLDYWLARLIAQTVSRERGVRAFRLVPYRELRRLFGLRSLEHRG